ncbi:MAG: C40 family peptidase [Gemmatimonadetes bacterium]|uniref:C40 family peptidase n=1 Tax=Candidatus Kutchimonas denitrificans TaxID=3056748 RepID=A0AAE4Z591_9BACT|nr:C40 family peptidase [Gemmatimonadota bacterium]NIR73579.1 C40 family peptidase [Candidatus Kutchimonas denitrificans]NIR99538.1 C40 family peptidase [Gemmatimonadota bacterium]NIT65158.1 C40 family peptidase [Gemmatimonadota bacterium]NIV23691.1 hypothetical protein [Gemmatimonadota bacterium]
MGREGARRIFIALICCVVPAAVLPGTTSGQRAVDLQVGTWAVSGPNLTLFSATYRRHVTGPLDFSLTGVGLIGSGPSHNSLVGVGPGIGVRGSGKITPYAGAGVALAVRAEGSPDVAAVWDVGAGVEFNPFSWFGIAVEVSRYVEDDGFRGFWNLREDDRRGWALSGRLTFRWGGGAGAPARTGAPRRTRPVEMADPLPISEGPAEPLDATSAALAYDIVDTAIEVMGEPYRWGGTSTDEGFDCSGLIWYAYRAHGVDVPRVSRDQARAGRPVPRSIDALVPGDVLLFADGGTAVTHVGLYIGNSRFIHATASGGVRVSSLSADDTVYDRWWFQRWVGARRLLR